MKNKWISQTFYPFGTLADQIRFPFEHLSLTNNHFDNSYINAPSHLLNKISNNICSKLLYMRGFLSFLWFVSQKIEYLCGLESWSHKTCSLETSNLALGAFGGKFLLLFWHLNNRIYYLIMEVIGCRHTVLNRFIRPYVRDFHFQWAFNFLPLWTGIRHFKLNSPFYSQIWADSLGFQKLIKHNH